MDIAALSIIMNQVQLKQDAGIAMLRKAMDAAEKGGSLVNQMLDKVNEGHTVTQVKLPHLGNNIDIFV
ncbi:YjfB family protein [Desulfallas thermosapovorans]|uniref:Putative motility protein YjfB-like n=1 Tax=Desulfallas thermosapovorans DSM 6562 TaxID=1121431 RepID=A0A5S4ZRI4_9FIRM|nr:YjfB family protein [Desulfallas thermosapovorans]TYO95517.1 putative motility protein YjfB-like [Desulfallas thermosapovorans DSM 6562]